METRKLIGLVGSKESTDKILKSLQKNFGLPESNAIGDIYEQGLSIIKPAKFKNLISETEIRQVSNKLGAGIPVNKHAGKKVEDEKELMQYLSGLADQYGQSGWAAKLFMDTDFFRRAVGSYVAQVTRKDDSDFLAKDLGLDYKAIKVYDSVEDKPENEQGPYVVVGGSTGKELKERIAKAFEKLEKQENKGVKK